MPAFRANALRITGIQKGPVRGPFSFIFPFLNPLPPGEGRVRGRWRESRRLPLTARCAGTLSRRERVCKAYAAFFPSSTPATLCSRFVGRGSTTVLPLALTNSPSVPR